MTPEVNSKNELSADFNVGGKNEWICSLDIQLKNREMLKYFITRTFSSLGLLIKM